MSKISEAKEKQGYVGHFEQGTPPLCRNCSNFEFDLIDKSYNSGYQIIEWIEQKSMRCAIGGFAVKKMASCDLFQKKGTK